MGGTGKAPGDARPRAPGGPAPLLAGILGRFRDAHRRCKDLPCTRELQGRWLEQLEGGGSRPAPQDADELFVVHTVLVLISRLVPGMRAPGRGGTGGADIMRGFAGWAAASPRDVRALADAVCRYDWRASRGDAMRQLYMGLVPAWQRRTHGEYYTPDWLAERVCLDVIDDEYVAEQLSLFEEGRPVAGILDPACGSGTFVYHAARRLLDSRPVRESRLGRGGAAGFARAMVRGIDVHPVAVEMAAANMRRLLGGAGPAGIQVFQGDSLLAGHPGPPGRGAGAVSLYTPGGRALALPRALLRDGDGIEQLVGSARSGRPLPPGAGRGPDAAGMDALAAAREEMAEILREEVGGGAWTWRMRNQAAPLLLSGGAAAAGRIVSNPPWVRLSRMADRGRADSVRRMAAGLGLYEGGKRATAFDIAALFVARCHDLYARGGGARAAWILPQAAMTGSGQWERLRSRFGGAVEAVWDLGSLPFPQHGPASAMLVGRGGGRRFSMALPRRGGRPESHDSWADAAARGVRLIPAESAGGGGRPEESEWVRGAKGRQSPVRNGATLFPAALVRVERGTLRTKAGTASFTTHAGRHGAWKEIGALSGSVPAGWIRQCVFGGDLVAFCAPTRTACVLPVGEGGDWLAGRGGVRFWRDAAGLYAARRGGGRHTPATLEERLDYQGCLSRQFGAAWRGPAVIYNKSGSRMYAAAVGAGEVIDNTLYSVRCSSAAEARYASALLNSDALQAALAAAKENQRHYDTYPWRKIPLPRFRRTDAAHRRLASLARRAEALVTAMHGRNEGGASRPSSLEEVRKSGTMAEIDGCAAEVLPGYARA